MKKFFIILLLPLFFVSVSKAQNKNFDKQNAAAIKFGYHFYDNNDFEDKWGIDSSSICPEISFEKKLTKKFSVEISGGFFSTETNYTYYINSSSFINYNMDLKTYYLSPSIKYFLSKNDKFSLYLGLGPDFYHCVFKGNGFLNSKINTDFEDKHYIFGAHALLGTEFIVYDNPSKHNYYNAPTGIFFEYKYTYANKGDFDKSPSDIFENLNPNINIDSKDLNAGGHTIFTGLRWHF